MEANKILQDMIDAVEKIKNDSPVENACFIPNKFYKDSSLTEYLQFRFPRSKSKRIRKKWRKKSENWKNIPLPHLFQIENFGYIGHPITVERTLRHLNVGTFTKFLG